LGKIVKNFSYRCIKYKIMISKNSTLFVFIAFALNLLTTFQGFSQSGQTLSIKDFALWGGGAPANNYNPNQGVSIRNGSIINGNVGSNHFIQIRNTVRISGNVYSGNGVSFSVGTQTTGNVFGYKLSPAFKDTAIFASVKSRFLGNLTSNGLIHIQSTRGDRLSIVSGTVSVPAPSTVNYKGPNPAGGVNNNLVFPDLPIMPANTPFDNQVGTQNIISSRVISPGSYGNLELRGNQTITFDGPGNYIFNEVFNTGRNNNIVFDFKNTTTGDINIFIRYEAQWGNISVRAINGASESRIFTEVHGDGTKRRAQNDGISFAISAPASYNAEQYLWLGNVWAPNGGIFISGNKNTSRPHILGALWSGIKVDIREVVNLSYTPPPPAAVSFIQPYYQPPTQGKQADPTNIIGAELTSLATNPTPIVNIPENIIFKLGPSETVLIEVISKIANDNELKQDLIEQGMTDIIESGPHIFTITGYFPIDKLIGLNSDSRIEYVRPWYPPVNNRGQVTSQGDTTMRTHLVRQRFGLDGSGVKIGVISDSYNAKSSAQNDVDQGDLPGIKSDGTSNDNPGNVQVLRDLQGNGKDEGRAMLQIVHDVAPKANLAFRTGFLSAGDFAKGILELADPSLEGGACDIIVDDLSYITEPFFRDGIVARTVDQVVSQGITYFTSAGNFGNRSYGSLFNGVSNPALIPSPGVIHQFGSTPQDIYQSIRLRPGNYTIVLQWDEDFHSLGETGGVNTDLDLYIVGANNFRLFGFNRSNLFKDPFEVCPFTVKEETIAKLMVVSATGNTNIRFKYIIFRGDATILDYNNADTSTIVGHANSNGAISVGAMLFRSFPTITPIWPGVASFSSRGGVVVRDPLSNLPGVRNKPDIIGPNGGNTTVDLGGSFFNDGDNYPNFFGTSAAAPHAAGVGALIMQGRKKFGLQSSVTPEEIRQQLITSAGQFGHLAPGFSFQGGHGFIQADNALLQIANARPIIDSLFATIEGSENGSDSFEVVLRGRYLVPNTQIFINDNPVPTTVSENGLEARAFIAPIPQGEDPAFQLFNPAKSPSEEDGGFSEKKYFFNQRRIVVVKAVNKTRLYNQQNPTFDIEITIDGIPINDPTINLLPADLKLDAPNITISTIANTQSKAGLYGIFVERTVPLELTDPLNNQFEFQFQSGTLNIRKLPLRITPNNQTIKYGEFPGKMSYTYETNINGIWELVSDEFLPEIIRLHEEYMAKNGLIVAKGSENFEGPLETEDLNNMSTLASFQSVNNAKKYVLENGQLRALVNEIDPSEIGNQRFIIETPLEALNNYVTSPNSATLTYLNQDSEDYSGLLNLKALAKGDASAALPNGQLKAMVNGQLMGMVNGQFESKLDAGTFAEVNGLFTNVNDIIFLNGQLRALVNNEEWVPVPNGQLRALVNGVETTFELSVLNGQLRALVNGEEMPLVNGQLRALVNGQEVSIANGQLRAMVNGQLVPIVNNELMGIANGQLRAMVNGEMTALINGQLFAFIDNEYEEVTELTLVNGQLRAMVNGQLRALVNGQLKAMVNGDITDIDNNGLSLVNGQLRAMVNGQLRAMVNGQLKALVNGQLQPLVNSDALSVEKVIQLANGQLKALVNGALLPVSNGQLRAMVNGQLRALVNGELMAEEENQLNFTVFENGQLKAMVNGQLQPIVNGQLKAMVNGQLEPVESYAVSNGQLKALVNGEEWVFPNGQLKALVNGQLKALVNNFDVSGENNNTNTMVLVVDEDLEQQQGDIGGMLSMAMITGINAGTHMIIPAAFINENYEVEYESGLLTILPKPITVTTENASKVYGEPNPEFSEWSISPLAYNESFQIEDSFVPPFANTDENTYVGSYPIQFYPELSNNYFVLREFGFLTITPAPLTIRADDKLITYDVEYELPELTITFDGLVGDDNRDSICIPFLRPISPKVINDYDRTITFTGVSINGGSNLYFAEPGQGLTLTGQMLSVNNSEMYCPGCITQAHIGMGDGNTNFFSNCYDITPSGTIHNININFSAPLTEGVYYITQLNTWWFYCGQFPLNNHLVSDLQKFAIAVVVVGNAGGTDIGSITANVNTTEISGPGEFPITLTPCTNLNPNYTITFEDGILTLDGESDIVCLLDRRRWTGDGNFNQDFSEEGATPIGDVTADGEPRIGESSFSFNGGYINAGTTGSVEGRGDFMVSAWVRTTSGNPMVVIQQRGPSEIDGEYILKIGGAHYTLDYDEQFTGKPYFMMFDWAVGTYEVFGNTTVNDGEWHFIKAERIGTTMNIYVDGDLDASIVTDEPVFLNKDLTTYIGYDGLDNGSNFIGQIDDIRVEICKPDDTGAASAEMDYVDRKSMTTIDAPMAKTKITVNRLYPNPASHTVRVELTEDVINLNEIQVLDSYGKSNRTSARKIDAGVYELNVSGLPRGIYFLKVRTETGIKSFKFVKM
jgi:hypothetical protein